MIKPEIISAIGFTRDCLAELYFRITDKPPADPLKYWDKCPQEDLNQLVTHLSNTEDPERRLIRKLLSLNEVTSILDVGCGPATEYQGYKKDPLLRDLKYYGLDLSERMLRTAKNKNPEVNLLSAKATTLPFAESSIETVLLKHVLEHHPKGYEELTTEAIRVASKMVIINFFHPPLPFIKTDLILRNPNGYVNNWYSRSKFEEFIGKNQKVTTWEKFPTPGISGQKGEVYLLKL